MGRQRSCRRRRPIGRRPTGTSDDERYRHRLNVIKIDTSVGTSRERIGYDYYRKEWSSIMYEGNVGGVKWSWVRHSSLLTSPLPMTDLTCDDHWNSLQLYDDCIVINTQLRSLRNQLPTLVGVHAKVSTWMAPLLRRWRWT